MYVVYEVFKSDGKRFSRFESDDHFDCEVWIAQHICDEKSVVNGDSVFIIDDF